MSGQARQRPTCGWSDAAGVVTSGVITVENSGEAASGAVTAEESGVIARCSSLSQPSRPPSPVHRD
jgi:hypothetical protein